DRAAIVPTLRSMTDQIVRSEIVFEYTMLDMELNSMLQQHFFGRGKKLRAARSRRQYKTLRLMLQNAYLLQKLAIVRTFKKVPKDIVTIITAINDLRNGVAHTFFIEDLPLSKRTYKGFDVFTVKGPEAFRKDIWRTRLFFMPWLSKFYPD